MKIVICKRNNIAGKEVLIPIMATDDEGEPLDRLAVFEDEEVESFCLQHPLASASINFVIDTETGESYTI